MTALQQLRILRNEIKEREALITELSDQAVAEAIAILSQDNKTNGQFEDGGFRFQLQRTDTFDFADHRRYPAQRQWRELLKARDEARALAAAHTRTMKALMEAFAIENPDRSPDESKFTIKVLE